MSALDSLLDDLASARIGQTFNQFRLAGRDDVQGAPDIRLANLRSYLDERGDAPVLALGEAAGYQGMRWSGIAFTSERDLQRWGPPYQPTCRGARCWSEPSGTMVHRLLEQVGMERRVALWNSVPTHPHVPGQPLSNRRPTADEIAGGWPFTERLLAILPARLVVAVGRVAEAVLAAHGVPHRYVRHPANAGGAQFAAQMRVALSAMGQEKKAVPDGTALLAISRTRRPGSPGSR